MMKNWTISCHDCGNNHAVLDTDAADTERKYKFVVRCPCGAVEDVTDIVSED
jgi:uncharacterized Zn finger protein